MPVFSSTWEKQIDCYSGSVTVDRLASSNEANYQLVIRDQRIIDYFLRERAFPLSRLNTNSEFILSIFSEGEWSFRGSLTFEGNSRKFTVSRVNGDGLLILIQGEYPFGTPGEQRFYKVADWYLPACYFLR
jgi:hypothetical protein